MNKKSIYLDYAATTPMDPAVFKAMESYFVDNFYNPSASYLSAKAVKRSLDHARSAIAQRLGAKPAEIIFTAGATEANNLAIQGVMRQFPEGEILISSIEHDSVRTPAWLFDCREIAVNKQGLIDPQTVLETISASTVMVSIGLVNNEIGTLQPLKELSAIVRSVREKRRRAGNDTPLYLHTDAAQAGNYFDLNTARLGVDMMSINGGKLYGPKQSGALFVKSGVVISPLICGGGQEWGMRAGTENVPAIIGLAAAVDIAQGHRTAEVKRLLELKKNFIENIQRRIESVRINGHQKHAAPHIINVTIPGVDNERLMMELDEAGIQCSVGSACHASSAEPSHVLSAIGLASEDARSSLRFSMGRGTTRAELDKVASKISSLTASNR